MVVPFCGTALRKQALSQVVDDGVPYRERPSKGAHHAGLEPSTRPSVAYAFNDGNTAPCGLPNPDGEPCPVTRPYAGLKRVASWGHS